jgi:SAM-dependent methyltransferase
VSLFTRWMARRCGGMAAFYEQLTEPLEQSGVAQVRARLAGDLTGKVLELGCGTGLNFAHYRAGAEVTAIEPLEEFRSFAARRAAAAAAPIHVRDGEAQNLPFPDHSFDAALATLVFCSIPALAQGLGELRRVLRPNAPVRFFEHVRSERRFGALLQDLSNPLWRWMMDGCNLNRDTVAAIRAAGFTIERVQAHHIRTHFPMREVHARS